VGNPRLRRARDGGTPEQGAAELVRWRQRVYREEMNKKEREREKNNIKE